jgi:transcriptional regulator with XRE-family HTH domain
MERKSNSKRTLPPRKLSSGCPCCGNENPWVLVTIPQQASCRGKVHDVIAEVTQCRHCDAVVTSAAQDEALLEKSKKAHAQWLKQMIKSSREKLKLTHREFAVAVGISPATLSRAVAGDSLIDPSTEELLLIKTKQLRVAREIEELLNLPLDQNSRTIDDLEPPCDPICNAADSNELALAA